ncbi:MAG: hypothetical protein AAF281_17000 [Pseudomonadota bacterium]
MSSQSGILRLSNGSKGALEQFPFTLDQKTLPQDQYPDDLERVF